MADHDDKTVKQMLDAATRAELERWFGLPSFDQLAEDGKQAAPPVDPEMEAARERRDAAIAAVDPALLEAHRQRTELRAELLEFKVALEPFVDPSIALFDPTMADRAGTIAEPREVEIPQQLEDDLKDCTPQALLRDLHRTEQTFEKVFEIDTEGHRPIDIVAVVAEAMSTRWAPALHSVGLDEARAELREAQRLRRQPWAEIKIPTRGAS